MEFFPSLASIAKKYDGFILDLWGVVHDGSALYPGAKNCLELLRRQNKKIVFLSNAPRRASNVEATLNKLGITPDLYDHVLSSGEVAWRFLNVPNAPKTPYFYLGPEKDAGLLDGLDYTRTTEMGDAAFILNVDLEFHGQPLEEVQHYLDEARAHGLPMICVNPDIEVVKQDGTHIWCAGAVAGRYADMGGEVSYFGKPYGAVYDVALSLLDGIKRDAIIGVGDNIDTDIRGAIEAGIDSALVTGGILAREMGTNPNPYDLREKCERAGSLPTYVIPGLTWKKEPA